MAVGEGRSKRLMAETLGTMPPSCCRPEVGCEAAVGDTMSERDPLHPCLRQGVGTGSSLKSLLNQTILCFRDLLRHSGAQCSLQQSWVFPSKCWDFTSRTQVLAQLYSLGHRTTAQEDTADHGTPGSQGTADTV